MSGKMEKFNEVLLVDCSHILNQKQNINPKIIQMKLEIEKIFSKPSKKTHNFMDLLQSLDNSFNKKRAHRKTEQVKIQKKLAILSQELKKFNEKPLMINFKAIVRENMKENSNSKQNFQNFSFAKEKTEEKERQINSKKWQNQLKLLSSDFQDPKDTNFLFSENIKEDFKNFGLAEPQELQETSSQPQPPLILQDLNCDLISPKISEKQRKNLEKNYCSLVQYKSVSPKKHENNRDFESYLKDFKENKEESTSFFKNTDHYNKENMMRTDNNSRINESLSKYSSNSINNDSLSKYSSNSTRNNYKRVIENQKRFIGNFHKQVYNTISGRNASPSYQDYVKDRKKH